MHLGDEPPRGDRQSNVGANAPPVIANTADIANDIQNANLGAIEAGIEAGGAARGGDTTRNEAGGGDTTTWPALARMFASAATEGLMVCFFFRSFRPYYN